MQIRFADSRPAGDYALVLPVAGKDRSGLGSLGSAQQAVGRAALDRQRFEGEAASASEQFIDDDGSVAACSSSAPGRARRRRGARRSSAAPPPRGC